MAMPTRTAAAVLAVALAAASSPAFAVDLAAGKRLVAREGATAPRDKIVFQFVNDPALFALESPLCPATTRIQLVTDGGVLPAQDLDCNHWSISGPGFRYRDQPAGKGSLRKITYRAGRLIVQLKGAPYSAAPVAGPVGFIETRVQIGDAFYCGRWQEPPGDVRKNTAGRVVIRGPTAACELVCGNSIVEVPEECDDGNLVSGDGCDANCTPTACGNGIQTSGEECDDGNAANGDGCRADCTVEGCGDGILDAGEQCDDDNTANGDCCSATCQFEAPGSACASDGNACTDDVCDGAGTCTNTPNNAPCDDGQTCTTGDVCAGGECVGTLLEPWINEVDYDGSGGDTDEFIELAGPAGKDLSGYEIVVVEGGGLLCGTGAATPGQAYSVGALPGGTVLADDTGTGVGFLVVCFAGTSGSVPGCDVVLAGDGSASNLPDGHLLNVDETSCPDGAVLLDADGDVVDAFSYEGIVPNVAPFGGLFHVFPPYSAPRDDGFLAGVSIEKTTSTNARAQNASEWRDPSELGSPLTCQNQIGLSCPTNTRTPGAENPLQNLACPAAPPYGSASHAFLEKTVTLLE